MTIDLYTTEKGGKNTLVHDLNFAKGRYEAKHVVTFKNPSAALINILRDSGPVPGDENGTKRKGEKVPRKKTINSVDMEKLADGLVKLGEDDLLQVVQMIHDNKSDETYTKNDIEREYPQFQCGAPLTIMQRASSTSTCTPYQIHWSKCFGTLCRAIAGHERSGAKLSYPESTAYRSAPWILHLSAVIWMGRLHSTFFDLWRSIAVGQGHGHGLAAFVITRALRGHGVAFGCNCPLFSHLYLGRWLGGIARHIHIQGYDCYSKDACKLYKNLKRTSFALAARVSRMQNHTTCTPSILLGSPPPVI